MYVTYEKNECGYLTRVWTYAAPYELNENECQWIIPGTVGGDD